MNIKKYINDINSECILHPAKGVCVTRLLSGGCEDICRLSYCRFVWRECDTFPDSELDKETSGDEKTN